MPTTAEGNGLDKITRKRSTSALGGTAGEPTITLNVKDWMRELDGKLDDLAKIITESNQLSDRRLALLEQATVSHDLYGKEIELIKKDFAGFERRLHDHERNAFHTTGEAAISKLTADMTHIEKEILTQQALEEYIDEVNKINRTNRQWLIGTTVAIVLFILREMPNYIRFVTTLATPVPGG